MTPAEELAVLGSAKETVNILGRKFVLKTLDSDQEASATAASSIFDEETKKLVLKVEKLARAIETIEGVPFLPTEEEKTKGVTPLGKARSVIFRWHPPVVDRVYAAYDKMEKKRESVIEEIEKNGMSPATSSGAGK